MIHLVQIVNRYGIWMDTLMNGYSVVTASCFAAGLSSSTDAARFTTPIFRISVCFSVIYFSNTEIASSSFGFNCHYELDVHIFTHVHMDISHPLSLACAESIAHSFAITLEVCVRLVGYATQQ